MKERIKKLRNSLGLTQQKFADKLGLKRQTIAAYEIGNITPSDSTILLICKEFDINEDWLRYGKEPMKKWTDPEDRYSHNLAKLAKTDDETIMNWVNMIADTNPAALKEIEGLMKKLLGI